MTMKMRLVPDEAERRVRSTARGIVFALALTAVTMLSLFAATSQRPNSETASNRGVGVN